MEANEGKEANMCPLFTITQVFNAVGKYCITEKTKQNESKIYNEREFLIYAL